MKTLIAAALIGFATLFWTAGVGHADNGPYAPLVGVWQGHHRVMKVDPDGSASFPCRTTRRTIPIPAISPVMVLATWSPYPSRGWVTTTRSVARQPRCVGHEMSETCR
jgi:hypothetical protein